MRVPSFTGSFFPYLVGAKNNGYLSCLADEIPDHRLDTMVAMGPPYQPLPVLVGIAYQDSLPLDATVRRGSRISGTMSLFMIAINHLTVGSSVVVI